MQLKSVGPSIRQTFPLFSTHISFEISDGLQDSEESSNSSQLIVGSPGQVGEEGNAVQLQMVEMWEICQSEHVQCVQRLDHAHTDLQQLFTCFIMMAYTLV